MRERERMLAGQMYSPFDDDLSRGRMTAKKLTRLFNASTEEQEEERQALLKQLFRSVGRNVYIEPPFRADYGCNTSIGNRFFGNYDCIILDVCEVTIGDNVFLGPRVSIFTASHPIDAEARNSLLEYGKPVHIGNDVWIGGNTTINPGVTIGSNVVIGSGSVVVKDIPDGVVAVGNPARVIRNITPADKEKWQALAAQYREEKRAEKRKTAG